MLPTPDQFNRYAPVAKDPNNKVYVKCIAALEAAAERLQRDLLGPIDIDDMAEHHPVITDYLCKRALLDMLPQLDLVITPTGAGVVSNDTLAPASRDRVEALARQLRTATDELTDAIILLLVEQEAWGDTPQAARAIPAFLSTGNDMRRYAGNPTATRADATTALPDIEAATLHIRHLIGDPLTDHLLRLTRHPASPSTVELAVITNIRTAIGLALKGNHPAAQAAEARLLANIEANLTAFPLYATSAAYRANHTPAYQSPRDSGAFFFN